MMKHSLPKPPILDSGVDTAKQQLQELGIRIRASVEPPITEIEETLEKYFGARALPIGDTPTPQGKRAVQLAVATASNIVIQCDEHLSKTKLDLCFLKAWPGIWSWLQFFEDQCYQKTTYGTSLGLRALLTICSTLQMMSNSKALRARLTSTPGVVTLIVRHWKEEGHDPSVEREFQTAGMPRPFTRVLNTLLFQDKQNHTWAPDIIMASGGTKAAATNAIKHLNDVCAEKPPNLRTIYVHISLVESFCSSTELRLAMLVQGMVPSTIQLLSWLGTQPTHVAGVGDIISICTCSILFTLQGIMKMDGPMTSAIQALDADIIPIMLKSACRVAKFTNDISSICSSLLSNTLCQFLVFRPVVRSAAKALKRVDRLKLEDSSGGPVWKAWIVFQTLVCERIYILDNISDKGEGMFQRCHRVDCGNKRDNLLRCSGCLSVYYCNRACQKMDWTTHKPACQRAQQHLHGGMNNAIKNGDCYFIGRLVAHDICAASAEVSKMLLDAMKLNAPLPASEFAFILSYNHIPVKIKVVLVDELRGICTMLPIIEEASQSNGQLMVAKAEVQGGFRLESLGYTIPAPPK